MCCQDTKDFACAVKEEETPILANGWTLENSIRIIHNPLMLLVALPLSSMVGVVLSALCFLMFLLSKWILMLGGLFWLNGERIGLWPLFLFCIKAGAVLPPVVICCHTAYSFVTVTVHGGGVSAFRKIRAMKLRDMPNGIVAL